ncbi:MAG: SoxR reducing system RseC family protein [Azoarcus sp.]|jgi:sigma-E factor negative regulatory protein RseC|nr:SoxR reducing system RseC family protein [Azoarcus sp.]
MIALSATVVAANEGKIRVRLLENPGGCGHCDEPGGCHGPRFAEMFKGERVFSVDDPIGLAEGQRVKLVVDAGVPLKAAWASYGLGTALVLLGAALGVWLMPPAQADIGAALGVVLGAALMGGMLYLRARRGAQAWRVRVERDGGDSGDSGDDRDIAAPRCRVGQRA